MEKKTSCNFRCNLSILIELTKVPGSTVPYGSHRLCHHVHLLEIHQSIEAGFVALVGERHVFEQQGHEGDHRGLKLSDGHSVEKLEIHDI